MGIRSSAFRSAGAYIIALFSHQQSDGLHHKSRNALSKGVIHEDLLIVVNHREGFRMQHSHLQNFRLPLMCPSIFIVDCGFRRDLVGEDKRDGSLSSPRDKTGHTHLQPLSPYRQA